MKTMKVLMDITFFCLYLYYVESLNGSSLSISIKFK